jgi:hypothetical protein
MNSNYNSTALHFSKFPLKCERVGVVTSMLWTFWFTYECSHSLALIFCWNVVRVTECVPRGIADGEQRSAADGPPSGKVGNDSSCRPHPPHELEGYGRKSRHFQTHSVQCKQREGMIIQGRWACGITAWRCYPLRMPTCVASVSGEGKASRKGTRKETKRRGAEEPRETGVLGEGREIQVKCWDAEPKSWPITMLSRNRVPRETERNPNLEERARNPTSQKNLESKPNPRGR